MSGRIEMRPTELGILVNRAVFGDNGRHARAAPGVGTPPRSVAVAVEAMFEIGKKREAR